MQEKMSTANHHSFSPAFAHLMDHFRLLFKLGEESFRFPVLLLLLRLLTYAAKGELKITYYIIVKTLLFKRISPT